MSSSFKRDVYAVDPVCRNSRRVHRCAKVDKIKKARDDQMTINIRISKC